MRAAHWAIAALAAVSVGCGDSGTGGAGGTSTSTTTNASSSATGSVGCAVPTDAGNTQGVGHYCTPGGGECNQFPKASLCLADVGEPENFCTRIGCMTQADCGPDAGCHLDTAGSACVPCKCDDTAVGCSGSTTSSSSSSSSGSSSSASSSAAGG